MRNTNLRDTHVNDQKVVDSNVLVLTEKAKLCGFVTVQQYISWSLVFDQQTA